MVDKAAAITLAMFNNPMVAEKMKASGSPQKVMNHQEAQAMFLS